MYLIRKRLGTVRVFFIILGIARRITIYEL